jgi:hypothetical protein
MCDRCKEIEKYFRERIREAVAMFPADNETHIQEVMKANPDTDEIEIRKLFASQGANYGLAIQCVKAGLAFLLSENGYNTASTAGLATGLLLRLEARRHELLMMQSGSDGGMSTTPPSKPVEPTGEKLH